MKSPIQRKRAMVVNVNYQNLRMRLRPTGQAKVSLASGALLAGEDQETG
jgi:hypothetical protein